MLSVLVVDDSPVDRMLAAKLLKARPDVEVAEAENGRDALALMRRHLPAVVVTDILMPEMDGLELLDATLREFPHVPVILMTSKGSEEMATRALEAGAASYVPKRRLAADLPATVERVWCLSRDDEVRAELSDRLTYAESGYRVETDLDVLMSITGQLTRSVDYFWDCPPTLRTQLSVALEEALTNAYFYGNLELDSGMRHADPQAFFRAAELRKREAPYCDRHISISARLSDEEAVFVIEDEGRGFDTALLARIVEERDLNEEPGRGLRLMQTFMDDVRFNDAGNRVTLIKRGPDRRGADDGPRNRTDPAN